MTNVRILFLGPVDSPVLRYLERVERELSATLEPITLETLEDERPDFIVCHGYRHIIGGDVLARLPDRIVNLHILLLPWNRGADPNVWSFLEDTPRGVTVHYVDAGIDTGDVIVQKAVEFGPDETLRTSYAHLQDELARLFAEHWPAIREGRCARRPQEPGGSAHRIRDLDAVRHLLIQRWDTPVSKLIGQARGPASVA